MEETKLLLLQENFMIMRANGFSFAKISKEIGVSKPTLIKWSRALEAEMNNRACLEIDELREEYHRAKKERIKAISSILSKIEQELEKRNFSDIPTDKLIKTYHDEIAQLNEEFSMKFKMFDEIENSGMGTIEYWKSHID